MKAHAALRPLLQDQPIYPQGHGWWPTAVSLTGHRFQPQGTASLKATPSQMIPLGQWLADKVMRRPTSLATIRDTSKEMSQLLQSSPEDQPRPKISVASTTLQDSLSLAWLCLAHFLQEYLKRVPLCNPLFHSPFSGDLTEDCAFRKWEEAFG